MVSRRDRHSAESIARLEVESLLVLLTRTGAEKREAQPWINHDKAQSARLRYAPGYYE
jgi:hypothetical protein